MASKKSEATEKVVEVAVPAGGSVARWDVYKAALVAARERDEIPLASQSSYDYEIVGEPSNPKDGQRTYKVKISWQDDGGEPVDIEQHAAALAVPTAVPASDDS